VLADSSGEARLQAVAFNIQDTPLGALLATAPALHLYGELSENYWQGQSRLQLIIEDAAVA